MKQLLLIVGVSLIAKSLVLGQPSSDAPRIAIVSAQPEVAEAADLLTTELSTNPKVKLLEHLVPRDLVEAYRWFHLAAHYGNSGAAAQCEKIKSAFKPDQMKKAAIPLPESHANASPP